ncbi:MAG: hypothetical protein OEU54_05525 [Gemmatimonadota bacterium]|nr:hypothetical protein [Gemmatimonadota bacterium]
MKLAAIMLVAGSGVIALPAATVGQLTYSKGQNVSPAFEGWTQNADGSYELLFGYMNRNWLEELDVPVGDANYFSPGPADRGQPTHFMPRRNRWVFKVRVPADWGDKELVWTLTTAGKTEHAYASLRPDYVVDNVVIASETGALGAGSSNAETRSNTPPVISLEGGPTRRVTVGQTLELTAVVEDDGIPRARSRDAGGDEQEDPDGPRTLSDRQLRPPARVTVNKVVGLHLAWFVYRGEADIEFDPPQVKAWEDTRTGANSPWAPLWQAPQVPEGGRYVVRVTFDRPGTYVLRARADDGGLYSDAEVTVIVGPATTS